MADCNLIEWTDSTCNAIFGCSPKSPGCANCYAARLAGTRLCHLSIPDGLTTATPRGPAWTGETRFVDSALMGPLRWRRLRRVFLGANTDLWHEATPDSWVDRTFAMMAAARRHTFQLLTKRPDRMRRWVCDPQTPRRVAAELLSNSVRWGVKGSALLAALGNREKVDEPEFVPMPLSNVWIGVSAERQKEADERIPMLLMTPAARRFVSMEPLLGAIDLRAISMRQGEGILIVDSLSDEGWAYHGDEPGELFHRGPALGAALDWVIVGGESGPRARPMHPSWVRSIRDQCAEAGTPFLFKQWGEWGPDGPDPSRDGAGLAFDCQQVGMWGDRWETAFMWRVGKRRAGRRLDGMLHDDYPRGEP